MREQTSWRRFIQVSALNHIFPCLRQPLVAPGQFGDAVSFMFASQGVMPTKASISEEVMHIMVKHFEPKRIEALQ